MAGDSVDTDEVEENRENSDDGKELPIILTSQALLEDRGVRVIGLAYGAGNGDGFSSSAAQAEAELRASVVEMGGDTIIDPIVLEPHYINRKIYTMMHCRIGQCFEQSASGGSE